MANLTFKLCFKVKDQWRKIIAHGNTHPVNYWSMTLTFKVKSSISSQNGKFDLLSCVTEIICKWAWDPWSPSFTSPTRQAPLRAFTGRPVVSMGGSPRENHSQELYRSRDSNPWSSDICERVKDRERFRPFGHCATPRIRHVIYSNYRYINQWAFELYM